MNATETTLEGIPETMLIPLWARAVETGRDDSIIRDPKAVEMVASIPYDFSRFEGARLSQVGCCVRTTILDDATREFIQSRANPVIVNLGAGLDTRFERLGREGVRWYDLDVPDAMAFRRRFFEEGPANRFVAKSIFDTTWMDDVEVAEGDSVLFIAEGLLMYFEPDEVRSVLVALANRFAGAEMLLELVAPMLVGKGKQHDSVSKLDSAAEFKWGPKDSRVMETWDRRIRYLREWSYYRYARRRWGLFGVIARLPVIGPKLASRIVHVRFE
jgi:O-methyltransferase involved in polyketide biosynthesis